MAARAATLGGAIHCFIPREDAESKTTVSKHFLRTVARAQVPGAWARRFLLIIWRSNISLPQRR